MTTKRRACALLIGVETYDNLGNDKQLRAGRNDVLAFWKVCRRLGFAPENIRLLTSPKLEVQDLIWAEQELASELTEYKGKTEKDIENRINAWFPPQDKATVFMAEATRGNIESSVKWLKAHRANPGEAPVDRIFTYSGHGAPIAEGGKTVLALCPRDVVQEKPDTYLSIEYIKNELQDVDENLTMVLDCCFAENAGELGTPRGSHRVATLASGASNTATTIPMSDLGPRVFCASGANESSYQALLGGYWYSAFTWALTVALEQWRIVPGTGNRRHSTISHAELLFRTRMLLEALSFPQHPVLLDGMGNKPVFANISDADANTTFEPDTERKTGQLTPDFKCSISCVRDTIVNKLADVFVVPAKGSVTLGTTTYKDTSSNQQGTELWWYFKQVLTTIANVDAISIATTPLVNDSSYDPSNINATMIESRAVKENWPATPVTYKSGTTSYFFSCTIGSKTWGLELNVGTDGNGKPYLNGIQWYQQASGNTSTIGGNDWLGTTTWTKKSVQNGANPFPGYLAQTSM